MELSHLQDLSAFLREDAREDVKILALQEILGFTGTRDASLTIEGHETGKLLIECALHQNEIISKTACLSLVNISAFESGANFLLNSQSKGNQEFVSKLLKHILNPESKIADAACMILSNLTRTSANADIILNCLSEANILIQDLINIFTKINYNSKGCNLNYLSSLFSNLSQNHEFRRSLMNQDTSLIQKLLPFVQFHESAIRKAGIVRTLRNCVFELDYHEWLLGPDVDILPCLLLPLAGPEQFDEEDNDKLPLDLQYLGDDKEREPDSDIRKMLLEALLQLCANKFGREFLRNKNAYVILREYHKWEEDKSLLLACENIVDILIRTEEEINEGNLKELEVPEKYLELFKKMDDDYLK